MNKQLKIIIFSLVGLIILTVIIGFFKSVNIPVLEPKGTIGSQQKDLIYFALALSLIVVIPVYVLLFAFAWRYRATNKKAKYSPDLAGNRLAEAIWWLIPTVLIVVLSVVTWRSSHILDPYRPLASSEKPLRIQVVAMDWKWLFIYPNQRLATVNYIQVPVGRPLDFQLTSASVMNSFWVPQLGGQIYTMPGMSTKLHLAADHTGTYSGSSANISGQGFAGMTFKVQAVSPDQFDKWVKATKLNNHPLTKEGYQQLVKPSQNVPSASYSPVPSGLYNSIIMEYMTPATDRSPVSARGQM